MAKENLKNLHIYGEKTDFMDKYIRFMAIAPKIKGEYLLMTTQAAEANAFARIYKQEHPEVAVFIDECRLNVNKPKSQYFHLLYRDNNTLYIKTIVKH